MVVNPVRRASVMVLTGNMGANPDPDIGCHIEVSCGWDGFVLIDRRSPVNRDAAQNKAKEERYVQPVTPPYEVMMSFDHEHARLCQERARGVRFAAEG